MAEIDGGNLYDMNKGIIGQLPPISKENLKDRKLVLGDYILNSHNTYYMLLCHEKRDYTLFNLNDNVDNIERAVEDIIVCINNRGTLIDISIDTNNVPAIWMKWDNEEVSCYYFFGYDQGVIDYYKEDHPNV